VECKNKCWIDLTTSSPRATCELGLEFRRRGGKPIDAPVTGSVDAAIRGDMPMFVGGEDSDVEGVRSVIEAMGRLRRVGAYGNGYVAKLVNNQLWKIHAAAIGEAMVAAKLSGLEPEIWWEVMKGGAADSFVMQHDVPSIFAGHYDPSFPLALCLKDLALIEELLQTTGSRGELTRATHARFKEAAERYGKDAGEMTVCKLIEDDAGVSLQVAGNWIPPWEVARAKN
jgi:3-hydroxyisobutyrate dehydrogenase-like beta-hydroxyacid dehydrogenase